MEKMKRNELEDALEDHLRNGYRRRRAGEAKKKKAELAKLADQTGLKRYVLTSMMPQKSSSIIIAES